MISSGAIRVRGYSWIKILLFTCALLPLTAVPARAQSVGGCVANFGGVIDGFVTPAPPSQINIDGDCRIRNFPASNPLTSNISFDGTTSAPASLVVANGAAGNLTGTIRSNAPATATVDV